MVKSAIPIFVVLAVLMTVSGVCAGGTIYVDANSPDDPGTGTFSDPYRWIQRGINAAVTGDTVQIQPGVYTGKSLSNPAIDSNYDLDPNGLNIIIQSQNPNDPNVVANTIIDPNSLGRAFYVHNGEDPNCVIAGLTIRNGYASGSSGGGIYCDSSSPSIINCTITNCSADFYGGGVYCYNSNAQLTGCTISNNSAGDGGGIECEQSSVTLTNCVFSNNQATIHGGAVDGYDQGNPTITNCTFVKNTANVGGAVCLRGSDTNIQNSILWANEAVIGGQLGLLKQISTGTGSTASVGYSDVQDGQTDVSKDPGYTLTWGSGNIEVDPNFVSFDPNGSADLWDLHLQSTAGRWNVNTESWTQDPNTSGCIDAGDPNSTYSAEPWPNGKRVNMGAYGRTNKASMNGNKADFDVDGAVDESDLAELVSKWLWGQEYIENLNLDDSVDLKDFIIFAEYWLWQEE